MNNINSTGSSTPVLRAGTDNAERTYRCENPHCIENEHTTDDGPDFVIHVAARAEHGSVELEVYQRPEDGQWKLELYANFLALEDGVTLTEAMALAEDIEKYAHLVDRLNFKENAKRNLRAILSENNDATPIEEFGDLNDVSNFTEAGKYIQRYGRDYADLVTESLVERDSR